MMNCKLHRYKCQLVDFSSKVMKTEYILANCQSDAIIIMADKYKKIIDRLGYDIKVTLMID
jgi:hypothetical protein